MIRQILIKVLFLVALILCASSFIPAPVALVDGFLFKDNTILS